LPKRINNIYDNALTFSKIKAAYYRTARRKKKNSESIRFEMYLEDNIIDIYRRLKNETYDVGKYRFFKVYEPKERLIYSLPFYDRVVQQLYVYEYIMPYMLSKFITTSYACIPGRGLHHCVAKVQEYMKKAQNKWKEPYIVKYDIAKFFYSIDRKLLFEIIKKYYKDKKFLRLTEKFINFVTEDEIEVR
jgi:retron-type reverse transcriptase